MDAGNATEIGFPQHAVITPNYSLIRDQCNFGALAVASAHSLVLCPLFTLIEDIISKERIIPI